MRIMCMDIERNIQVIEVDYFGWETDAKADGSEITGMSFYSSSLNQSYLIESENKDEFNKYAEELLNNGFILIKDIAQPYGDDGSLSSLLFGNN